MPLGVFSRQAALALLVSSAAACADTITQGGAQPIGSGAATNVRQSNEKPPTLVATAISGSAADLSSGPLTPGSRPGTFYRVTFSGTGFAAGASTSATTIGVTPDGSKHAVVRGIGVHPADGSYLSIWSASCPSGYMEMYEVVATGVQMVESNHVATGC